MRLPGFTAEASTTRSGVFFRTHAYANRSSAYTVTMAAQCCPPGYDATGCTTSPPPPPPHCCPRGWHCCGSCESGRCDDICVPPGHVCQ
jgi:hypothetical protein